MVTVLAYEDLKQQLHLGEKSDPKMIYNPFDFRSLASCDSLNQACPNYSTKVRVAAGSCSNQHTV